MLDWFEIELFVALLVDQLFGCMIVSKPSSRVISSSTFWIAKFSSSPFHMQHIVFVFVVFCFVFVFIFGFWYLSSESCVLCLG